MAMIWAVVTKDEMENYGTKPVFPFYREALGKENIKLAVVDDNDSLDFVSPKEDVILLRSAYEPLIEKIFATGAKTTAEPYSSYKLAYDKTRIAQVLSEAGIKVPSQHSISDIEDGKIYFVKHRYGSDSLGISLDNICKTKQEVVRKVTQISENYGEAIIEDFIDGEECTVACLNHNGNLELCALSIECFETNGIQTRDCKVGFKEYCAPMNVEYGKVVLEVAERAFDTLNIHHYARIDFRMDKDGEFYLIDVNLLPGLGPLDHITKCLTMCQDISYRRALSKIIETAN